MHGLGWETWSTDASTKSRDKKPQRSILFPPNDLISPVKNSISMIFFLLSIFLFFILPNSKMNVSVSHAKYLKRLVHFLGFLDLTFEYLSQFYWKQEKSYTFISLSLMNWEIIFVWFSSATHVQLYFLK